MVPSGNFTSTVLPGSALPPTVILPSDSVLVTRSVALPGGVVSAVGSATNSPVTDSPLLPAASVTVVVNSPFGCGVSLVSSKLPSGLATVVPVVPSGNLTSTVLPGSALPPTVILPSDSVLVTRSVALAGGVVSVVESAVKLPVVGLLVFFAASVAVAL